MKTKTFIVGLFLAMCLAISLPAIHQVAQTQALQGGTIGPAPVYVNPYYTVGADCVLYHAYWDGTATDHSSYGHDGSITGATFAEGGLHFDGTDDHMVTPDITETASIAHWSMYYWEYYVANSGDDVVFVTNAAARTGMWHWGTDFYYLGAGYGTINPVDPPEVSPTGSWFLRQIVYDGTLTSTNRLKVYWNGVQKTLTFPMDDIPATMPASTAEWVFGGYLDHTSYMTHCVLGEILMFTSTRTDMVDYFNATKVRYGVASLDPKYRNYRYAQEKKHEKSSLYRVPRNATVSSAMHSTRGASANYRPPIFQDASRQERARAN